MHIVGRRGEGDVHGHTDSFSVTTPPYEVTYTPPSSHCIVIHIVLPSHTNNNFNSKGESNKVLGMV